MKLQQEEKIASMFEKGSVVALGFFDGLHLGHMSLINETVRLGKEKNYCTVVYTFREHPLALIGDGVDLILDNKRKETLLLEAGIDVFYLEEFDRDFAALSPEEFVKEKIVGLLNAKIVVAGFNYNFGAKGSGNTKTLKELGNKYGFEVIIKPPVKIDGMVVSSSMIREYLDKGDLDTANRLLGRPFELSGIVTPGKQLARAMGYPTLNLYPEAGREMPEYGVYATLSIIDGQEYKGVTNVGVNPTVQSDKGVKVETHLFDYSVADSYGKYIVVKFIHHIRKEERYESVDALFEQIAKDKEIARELLGL